MRRHFVALISVSSLALAACGSSAAPTATTAATKPTTTAPKTSLGLFQSSQYGSILTSASGMTLYAFSPDTAVKSACSGSCTAVWAPLLGTSASITKGLSQSLVGSLIRPSGTHQLTYDGHPLYTYTGDSSKGMVNGQGVVSFGGTWNAVSASGFIVPSSTKSTTPSKSTSTTKGGSAYSY